jgi:hypothetical protein
VTVTFREREPFSDRSQDLTGKIFPKEGELPGSLSAISRAPTNHSVLRNTMIPLDGSIPTVLLIWFRTIADAVPTRACTTVMELIFGCMPTGHVTQAVSAITPRLGWRACFRIVRDSFVRQDCCVMALDDTLLLRNSKKAPGAARRFDHAGKPNRPGTIQLASRPW